MTSADSVMPLMPNVLKVFLENGQTKSFKYDSSTTVQVHLIPVNGFTAKVVNKTVSIYVGHKLHQTKQAAQILLTAPKVTELVANFVHYSIY